jgi:hypothetical protein
VQGEALAQKIGAKQYLECSAKMNEGVRDVFDHASRAAALQRVKEERSKDVFDHSSRAATLQKAEEKRSKLGWLFGK